jgi:hypothetical protein
MVDVDLTPGRIEPDPSSVRFETKTPSLLGTSKWLAANGLEDKGPPPRLRRGEIPSTSPVAWQERSASDHANANHNVGIWLPEPVRERTPLAEQYAGSEIVRFRFEGERQTRGLRTDGYLRRGTTESAAEPCFEILAIALP